MIRITSLSTHCDVVPPPPKPHRPLPAEHYYSATLADGRVVPLSFPRYWHAFNGLRHRRRMQLHEAVMAVLSAPAAG